MHFQEIIETVYIVEQMIPLRISWKERKEIYIGAANATGFVDGTTKDSYGKGAKRTPIETIERTQTPPLYF